MIPFSPSLPDLKETTSLRACSLGPYTAFVVRGPKALGEAAGMPSGLVKYLFALSVATSKEPHDLVYVVTAEQTGELIRQFARQQAGAQAHPELDHPVLCAFDSAGAHHQLGRSKDYADIDKFTEAALSLVRREFHIDAQLVQLQEKRANRPDAKPTPRDGFGDLIRRMFRPLLLRRLRTDVVMACRKGDFAEVSLAVRDERWEEFEPQVKALAFSVGLLEAAPLGEDKIVDFLLDSGAEVNWQEPDSGSSALELAAFRGQDSTVRGLLHGGANPNLTDKRGVTPLMLAVAKCSPGTVRSLLAAGADPNARTLEGMPVLEWALANHREHSARVLTEFGARPNV